jgi:hypothetical protein
LSIDPNRRLLVVWRDHFHSRRGRRIRHDHRLFVDVRADRSKRQPGGTRAEGHGDGHDHDHDDDDEADERA